MGGDVLVTCAWLGCNQPPRWHISLNFAPPRVPGAADLEVSYCYAHMAETMRDRVEDFLTTSARITIERTG